MAACSPEAATTSTLAPEVTVTPSLVTTTTAPPTTTTAPPTTTTAPPTTTSPSTELSLPTVMVLPDLEVGDLTNWDLVTVAVGDTAMVVAVADEPGERAQGLMNVEEMGRVEGMLFVFPEEGPGGFWMKDTLLRLDIAFFTSKGELVEVLTMEPCPADPCPLYVPVGEFRFALEAPAGRFTSLSEDTLLTFP